MVLTLIRFSIDHVHVPLFPQTTTVVVTGGIIKKNAPVIIIIK
jgi:hypothetical protein